MKGDRLSQVLLTGATGFIGSHVLERLMASGKRIRILAQPETVKDIPHVDRMQVVIGSVTEQSSLVEATQGVHTVYHLAGVVPRHENVDLMEVNAHGTENLL